MIPKSDTSLGRRYRLRKISEHFPLRNRFLRCLYLWEFCFGGQRCCQCVGLEGWHGLSPWSELDLAIHEIGRNRFKRAWFNTMQDTLRKLKCCCKVLLQSRGGKERQLKPPRPSTNSATYI